MTGSAFTLWGSRLMASLFLFAAVVQWNDPDPARWTAFYLSAAAAALWAAPAASHRPRSWIPAAGVAGVAILWGATLAPDVIGVVAPSDLVLKMSAKGGAVELGRELGGIGIVAVWLTIAAVLAFRAEVRRRAHPDASEPEPAA